MSRAKPILTIALALIAALTAAAFAKPVQVEDCRDLEVTRGGIWQVGPTYVSGQPTEATLKTLADRGVRGLRGRQDRLATYRRARLVEHAVTARLVTAADLRLLDRYR